MNWAPDFVNGAGFLVVYDAGIYLTSLQKV
jgi:hypothetical protein